LHPHKASLFDGSRGATAGETVAFTGDGEQLWEHSMMEEYGRLNFQIAPSALRSLTTTASSRAGE
jgi:hypothetical protein